MNKIELIQEYIDKCEAVMSSNNHNEAKILQQEIVVVFKSEIPSIIDKLSNYSGGGRGKDFMDDLRILKPKLTNYVCNIKEEHSKREHELELVRLNQLHISTHVEANPTQNQTLNATITLNNTIKQIDDIPEDSLSENSKDELKELLYSLEGIKGTKNKGKTWDKAKEILKFLVDKSADTAIAVLPYILFGLS